MTTIFKSTVLDTLNFKSNAEKRAGHIVSMTVGGADVPQAFEDVLDPMSPASIIPICGVLTDFSWNNERGGRIYLSGYIPYTNVGAIRQVLASDDKSAQLDIEFNCYEPEGEKTYYNGISTNKTKIKCKLIKRECSVDAEPNPEYTYIKNVRVDFVLDPFDKGLQEIHRNYGAGIIDVLKWGGTAAGA